MQTSEIIDGLRDLIKDREALIEPNAPQDNIFMHDRAVLQAAVDELSHRAAPENKPQWIPVSERLPNTTVIGCDKWGNVEPVLYIAPIKKWKIMPNACIEMNVIYWQPLPQPPKDTRKPEGSEP